MNHSGGPSTYLFNCEIPPLANNSATSFRSGLHEFISHRKIHIIPGDLAHFCARDKSSRQASSSMVREELRPY